MSRSRSHPGRRAAVRSAIVAAGLIGGAAVAESADGPSAADWRLALSARNSLWEDTTLERLNLGVSVRDGVATVRGPVPSTAVADQAVERLRNLPGVRGVVNETYVPAADEPLARSMPHPVTARRPTVSVAPAVPPQAVASPPAVVAPGKPQAAALGPPIAIPVKSMSLRDQIEAMRLWDRRYQRVRVELCDGVAVLTGTVARSADAWEFAAAIRQLPGVTGVMQKIGTDPR